MSLLFSSSEIENEEIPLETWKRDAHRLFSFKMSDREARFPCIPATQAFALGHLRYGFVSNFGDESAERNVSDILKEYGECSRSFGEYSSLILFFEKEKEIRDVLAYEKAFWDLLSQIRHLDNKPWPKDIPEDPEHPMWEFCYNDERYFVYCGTPAHMSRQSRNFPYFMLALTPRWVLDTWNAQPLKAAAIAPRIRARLAAYDTIPAHPELKQYGSQGNLEYKQYFLRDDDTAPSKCPFLRSLQQDKVKE
ncbi:YqcI/YcgG family protein [Paenibacillus sp. 2003]|uniref:YqcI/YcgG family protein n=1 Tax=Paenibacillus TaxID=44249 RepID=UPI0028671761|nr:YqcI/YcgG family protein [Paenibacillus sp. 2003]MDR6717556.1 FPC/CPF motif-containing protein YcgG [Paenibacillus sp. 2003]